MALCMEWSQAALFSLPGICFVLFYLPIKCCMLWGTWWCAGPLVGQAGPVDSVLVQSMPVISPWARVSSENREGAKLRRKQRVWEGWWSGQEHLQTSTVGCTFTEMCTSWGQSLEAEAHRPTDMGQYTDTGRHTQTWFRKRKAQVGKKKEPWGGKGREF